MDEGTLTAPFHRKNPSGHPPRGGDDAMTNQGEEVGAISHVGPVPNVSIHAHMRSGPHAITADPLDLVVVVELMFLFGEQARRRATDEPLVITPQSVLERLREMGVRSGNGSRLVGRDAVYASFARLRAKGYIRRIMASDEATGQRTGVAYEFYDWPAWNPEAPPVTESSQVTPTSGNAGSGDAVSRSGNRAKNRSPQVGATSGIAGSGIAGSSESSQVAPTSGNAGSPPHPPEEVTTSSPYPLTDSARQHPSQTEEGEEGARYAEEDLTSAAKLLQLLPNPWTQGRPNARRLAPLLLAVMAEQEWPPIGDVDRKLLTAQLTRNPGKMTNPFRLLQKDRIPNLPLYEAVARPAVPQPGTPPGTPAEIECDKGCDRGYLELEDRVAPCECLPSRRASHT